jgi:chromosome partitioning protein
MAKIITVAIQKGGVGKTATVKNLGASYSDHKKKVLVVDLDPQANATTGLGFKPDQLERTIVDLFTSNMVPVKDVIVSTDFGQSGRTPLDVLPSHRDMSGVIRSLNARQTGMVKSLLSEVDSDYDFIIIDTPPTESLATANALVASDYVLIPVQPDKDALDGVVEIMRAIDEVRTGLNPGLKIMGILPTMVDLRESLSKFSLHEIRTNYPKLMIEDWIPDTVQFGDSSLYSKPLVVLNPSHAASQNYLKLAARFL